MAKDEMNFGKDLSPQDLLRAAMKKLQTAKPEPSKNPTRRRLGTGIWHKPFHSEALGVGVDQIPEATEALRREGCMAEFDSDGRCIVTSEKQFHQVAKACGLKTGRDGYGVPTESGHRVQTGRRAEEEKQAFRNAVARGDYD